MTNNNSNNHDTAVIYLPIKAIKEDQQYSSLMPAFDNKDYEALKNDIAEYGIKVPLFINDNRVLLDGYTRLRIAKELQLEEVPCIVKHFNSRLEEELFILDINVHRRHLNTAQKVEMVLKMIEIEREKNRLKRFMNLKQFKNRCIITSINNITNEEIIKKHRVSRHTVTKVIKIKKIAMNDPKVAELWQEALQGKRTISSVYKKAIQREARANIRPISEELNITIDNDKVRILHGDFRYVLKDIPDNSIDLIFADPLYGKKHLDLIYNLFELASRVLKPSRFLAVMYGTVNLPEFFQIASIFNDFEYYWTIAVFLSNSHSKYHHRDVIVKWKPIILYQKKPFMLVKHPFTDAVISRRPNKDIHEWREDTIPILHVIKALTEEGDTVLDPMACTGTTIEACLMTNRRCIAVEKDEEMYEFMLRRFR
jgi:hypothetical protein